MYDRKVIDQFWGWGQEQAKNSKLDEGRAVWLLTTQP